MLRRVRIYDPNRPIRGRHCTEHANKKQVVTEHFRGSGGHKYINKRGKQGGIEALGTSVSYILVILTKAQAFLSTATQSSCFKRLRVWGIPRAFTKARTL
jgi:hypothetical protein